MERKNGEVQSLREKVEGISRSKEKRGEAGGV